MLENIDPNAIQDLDGARQAIVHVLNLIEDLTADLREAQAEIQRLRDENNRLKGEQEQARHPAQPETGRTESPRAFFGT